MKSKLTFIFFSYTWVFIILILIFAFILRLWQLGKIGDLIFDEVYFVKFAENYLAKTDFFDIHPPLGKLIIALGLKVFSDTSFTWRIMPAIFGTMLIGVGYLAGKEVSSKIAGIFTAIILALDGMILVYSRTGLVDIFLVFFILLGFYLFLKFANTSKILFLILAGFALGLAASIKYIGWLLLIIYILIILVKGLSLKKYLGQFFMYLVIFPTLIYLGFFLFNFAPNRDFFSKVFVWHSQSFNYNLTLKESHPYGSKWWGWFLLWRPIWLYFKDVDGKFIGINGLGNPLAWWSAIVVVPLLIWGTYKSYKNQFIILGAFLIFLLFWAPFNRVLFFYHALPSFIFLSLGISLWLERLLRIPYGKYLVALYFGVLFALFIYFLPIWVGLPLDSAQFYHRIWFKGWI